MKDALTKRMEFFDEMGCRASDHGLDYAMYVPASEEEIEAILKRNGRRADQQRRRIKI